MLNLGPGGGVRGAEIVAQGVPEHVATVEGSYTGQYLKAPLSRQLASASAYSKG